ncbi:hypothetical protein CRE_29674 [Caenorhabditis remanei]|uniref:Uncharacterized protein n=1 Tax=Caenorhabditis remanei TaxID=31234 RepID=E3LV52_CAERE|nr:hypothetical protein CRE_29674 [Caenorhabditis remanei]
MRIQSIILLTIISIIGYSTCVEDEEELTIYDHPGVESDLLASKNAERELQISENAVSIDDDEEFEDCNEDEEDEEEDDDDEEDFDDEFLFRSKDSIGKEL